MSSFGDLEGGLTDAAASAEAAALHQSQGAFLLPNIDQGSTASALGDLGRLSASRAALAGGTERSGHGPSSNCAAGPTELLDGETNSASGSSTTRPISSSVAPGGAGTGASCEARVAIKLGGTSCHSPLGGAIYSPIGSSSATALRYLVS
ncbi:unnamed protein product [Protopolystoma xenopodis]|uniref:Uncharacterized protein n=1 Tax=Protopolystoma xenopodis TaxID=117903 RepID=A0A448XA66_9PLAT|nr:unnamed protein product [Protopolystoma xenopodis]